MVEPQVIPADTSVFGDGVVLIIVAVDFLEFSLTVLKDKHLGWWEN